MSASSFHSLEEALADEHYPEVDLSLRRGRHIGRDDGAQYEYLVDAQPLLEPLYERFGCELIHKSDGYFFLAPRPSNDALGRRHLTAGEMLVGQTLALLYLDPATVQHGGVITRDLVLQRLSALLGMGALLQTLDRRRARKSKIDERIAAESVRSKVAEALRGLAQLGFVEGIDDGRLRLRPALMRFAEPVHGHGDRSAALERLVREGKIAVHEHEEPPDDNDAGVDEDSSS